MSAERVHQLLQAADRLPEAVRMWLVDGLLAWQQGQKLEQALGLGHDLDARDELLRTLIDLTPGDTITSRCLLVLDCIRGQEKHPRGDLQHIIERLQAMRVPQSVKQLRRIACGRRQDGWKIRGT